MKPNDSELTESSKSHSTGAIIGAIIGVILFIALIATIVILVRKKRMDRDGPPTHKPPPPKKHTTISYNAVPESMNDINSVPLTYYETQRAEPVTDLDSYHAEDDDDLPKPFDHSPSEMEGSEMLPPYYELREMDTDAYTSSLSRDDSFMSAPMIV